jgi:hypothetical protein
VVAFANNLNPRAQNHLILTLLLLYPGADAYQLEKKIAVLPLLKISELIHQLELALQHELREGGLETPDRCIITPTPWRKVNEQTAWVPEPRRP